MEENEISVRKSQRKVSSLQIYDSLMMLRNDLDFNFYPRLNRLMTSRWREEFYKRKKSTSSEIKNLPYLYKDNNIDEIRAHINIHQARLRLFVDQCIMIVNDYNMNLKMCDDENLLKIKYEYLQFQILELECLKREFNVLSRTCLAIPAGLCGEYAIKIGELISVCKTDMNTVETEMINKFGISQFSEINNVIRLRMLDRYAAVNLKYNLIA